MEQITEDMNMQMHKYGISEWREKACILSKEERVEVLKSLVYGTPSTLFAIAKLPFPEFATMYFKRLYPQHSFREQYLSDPEFGYKLYFLSSRTLTTFAEMLRQPDKHFYLISEELGFNTIDTKISDKINRVMKSKLEDLPLVLSGSDSPNKIAECKFAYLSQYINLEEAKRLNLSTVYRFEQECADGYEIDKKLDSLNTAARIIISEYIGLNGQNPKSLADIAKKVGVNSDIIKKILDILFPCMTKTLGEFRNKIGYIEERQLEGSAKEYIHKPYRSLDIKAEINYIKKRIISDNEKEILAQKELSPSEVIIYLARKYMYASTEQVARNLSYTCDDITKVMSKN